MYKKIVEKDQPLDEELPHGFIKMGDINVQHLKEVLEKVLKSKSRKHYEFIKRDNILHVLFRQHIIDVIHVEWPNINPSDIDFNIVVPNCNRQTMQIQVIIKKTIKICDTWQYAVFTTNYKIDTITGIMIPI